ncbi:hypothetical protein ACFLU4_06390 [Chloroflexota bacterium]
MILSELSFLEWFAYLLGLIIVLFFIAMGLYALVGLVKLIWRCVFGQVVEMSNLSTNHLTATAPLKDKSVSKEYKKALKILIEKNKRIIENNEMLIAEYQSIIEDERKQTETKKDAVKQ